MIRRTSYLGVAALAAVSFTHVHASAAPPTKEECIDAHSKAQDLQQSSQLAEAKRLFLVCAQASCPALVQSDCAKYGEELGRTVPSVSFSARDAKGADLFDTQVFVDDKLVASRLDEGKAYDIDPGKHTVKFVRAGVDPVVVTVVATVGEKGRNISATFGGGSAQPSPDAHQTAPQQNASTSMSSTTTYPTTKKGSRPVYPLIIAGVGAAAGVTGLILGVVGLGKVPDNCDKSTNKCAAPPGDKSFDDAKSGMGLANVGLGLGIGGAVVAIGGLVWYLVSSPKETSTTSAVLAPSPNGFTLSF